VDLTRGPGTVEYSMTVTISKGSQAVGGADGSAPTGPVAPLALAAVVVVVAYLGP